MSNSNQDRTNILLNIVFYVFVIVFIAFVAFNQKEPPKECSDEYIKAFGGADCSDYGEMRTEYEEGNSYFGN